jgi:hypothetical protein
LQMERENTQVRTVPWELVEITASVANAGDRAFADADCLDDKFRS